MPEIEFVLIGNSDGILRNLPFTLNSGGFKTRAITPRHTSIYNSKFVDSRLECPGATIEDFIESLIEIQDYLLTLDATFLWCSDEIMRRVSQSALDPKTKIHILPVKNPKYFDIFDSKVGQLRVFQEFAYPHPESLICENPGEVDELEFFGERQFLCKGSAGGGGSYIRKFSGVSELRGSSIPETWFPVIFQEFIPGVDVSVEAFYKRGEFILGLYSTFSLETGVYGPSVVREYSSEHTRHLESILEDLGKQLQIDGFVNVTLRKTDVNSYFLFEFDVRPNVWHGIYLDLEVNLKRRYEKNSNATKIEISYQQVFYEPDRLFQLSSKKRDMKLMRTCLAGNDIPGGVRAISSEFVLSNSLFRNRFLRLLDGIFPLRKIVLAVLIFSKKRIPTNLVDYIDRSPVRSVILRALQ